MRPAVLRRPEQGWSSLPLLLGMLLIVALAVSAIRAPTLEGQEQAGSLPTTTLAAALISFLLARSRIGLVRAHLLGASVGAIVLLVVAGVAVAEDASAVVLDGAVIAARMRELSGRLEVELGLFLGSAKAPPVITTQLVLGALLWTTAHFSMFSVFRHGRAGPAVMATGTLLILNEALPPLQPAAERLPTLLTLSCFSALAMLLVIRLQLGDRTQQWLRRHIADGGEVGRLFMRSGTLFVLLTVLAATSLTAFATVPRQELDAGALDEPLDDLRSELTHWLAVFSVDVTAGPRTTFDDRLRVEDTWQQGQGLAFVAEVEDGLLGNYWWGSAYADFDGRYWTRRETSHEVVPAETPLGVPIDASGAGPFEISAAVAPRQSALALGMVFAASEAAQVNRAVRVRSLGDREGLSEITFLDELPADGDYVVTSAVHDYESEDGPLTASQLRGAGIEYPAWVGRYVQVDDGASGRLTRQKAASVRRLAAARGMENPYDMARIIQDQLRELDYATSIDGLCGDGENVPECLLRTETGFCQHFASTMIMLLRELDVPARLVNGYLPGTLTAEGRYEVPMQALHAWVEVYFPEVGWVRFDPTPGEELRRYQQAPTRLPEGEPLEEPEPLATDDVEAPRESAPADEVTPEPESTGTIGQGGDGGGSDLWAATLVGTALAAVLLALGAGLLMVRLRWLPDADGGLAYGRVVGLAARLGHGPHPTQTEYEYAASLSETLPSVRDDLYVVADAQVQKRYGRRSVSGQQRLRLREAYARIRTALLRLTLSRRR